MKLEVGKVYEDASGDLVAIVAEHPWVAGLFVGVPKRVSVAGIYRQDGKWDSPVVDPIYHLVREHKPGQRG